jgi:glucose-1-phosphate cytidylyltransferase
VILCGGRGTRLQGHAPSLPKPMVEIGGRPILWHVIQIYLAQGFRRFLLLTGHRGDQISRFVDRQTWPADASLRCLDTGADTPTGGRLHLAAAELGDDEDFCLTYADGVADIELDRLLAFHRSHDGAATMTVVRPELQFGVAQLDGDGVVSAFTEKPRSDQWVNGGFLCLRPPIFELLNRASVLEREPLAKLAADGGLRAFRHEGFWDCLDTYKDALLLNDLWASGNAPWKVWD